MRAMPSGNRVVAVQRHAARPANRKARRVVVVEAAVVTAEVPAADKAALTPATRVQVRVAAAAQAELITAAQVASNARPVAHHARSRPPVRQAHVHVPAAQRAGSRTRWTVHDSYGAAPSRCGFALHFAIAGNTKLRMTAPVSAAPRSLSASKRSDAATTTSRNFGTTYTYCPP